MVNLDKLTYAGNLESLRDLEGRSPARVRARATSATARWSTELLAKHQIDAVMHLAAESHVDRSILGPEVFAETNVVGTSVLLEASRKAGVKRFLMVSTDEVYGSLGPTGYFTETTPLDPSSPYSASKAGADLLALAYHRTFRLHVMVSRCSQQLRPLPVPREADPADDQQRPRGQDRCRSTATA